MSARRSPEGEMAKGKIPRGYVVDTVLNELASIGQIASAINGLQEVLTVVADIKGNLRCGHASCGEHHARLTGGYMVGSIHMAIGALADSICSKGEALEELIGGALMDDQRQ